MALLLCPPIPPDTLAVLSVHPPLNSLSLEALGVTLRCQAAARLASAR
jgi:hypothetical protein